MALTELQVKNAKKQDKQYKLYDANGLFLLVKPNGSKYWRFKYRFAEKEKTSAFGVYPEIKLAEARDLRDGARKQLRAGIDPSLPHFLAPLTELVTRWAFFMPFLAFRISF